MNLDEIIKSTQSDCIDESGKIFQTLPLKVVIPPTCSVVLWPAPVTRASG
jgi:hypothetical protein